MEIQIKNKYTHRKPTLKQRLMLIDYYKILDVNQSANQNAIKEARKNLAQYCMSNESFTNQEQIEYLQLIHEAWLILSDIEAREKYDIEYNKYYNTVKSLENDEYIIEDEVIKKWMSNAKSQAVSIAQQSFTDLKGVAEVAGKTLLDGIWTFIIFIWFSLIIFYLGKCN